jgi:polar amino acid transport system substrate-binding protein
MLGGNMKFVLVSCAVLLLGIGMAAAQPVQICDDSAEWPPYSFFPRAPSKAEQPVLTGAMIELVAHIFALVKMDYHITAIPWRRCLHEVATFDRSHTYEMAIEGTLNEERLKAYYITAPVYTTTGAYWYSKRKFPQGPAIHSPDDLKGYRLCGILGYNYTGYQIPPELVKSRPKTYQAAFTMVSLGRCDLFLSNIPTVVGKAKLGELTIPDEVDGKRVPGLPSGTFHIFIAKSSPRAQALLAEINQAVLTLNYRGVTEEIFRKYLPQCGRDC